MMIVNFIDFLRDRLPTVIRICYGVLAAHVVIDFFVDKRLAHTWIEHIPGFWSMFGFVSCVVIIIISKWFGHQGIMTREDYYDK
jgi:hypothetical protein